ncbi:ribonuclease III domain-containing protein [Collybia nuda]|uniref:Large ribosomal subunit protein mL44 n=1 Tax=Collybia nuda TaxID=64659 RepID=A0A9P5YBZ5_9AGAR|nr:ribonuclease III domain-containing protein [Collybia nuda]
MGHVSKRLVTSAAKIASVSTANLPRFPPKEALFVHREVPKAPFSPETWATLQSPPSSALSAFSHRIGLASVLATPETVLQACTHSSFLPLYRQQYPHEPLPATNAQLAPLGNALMGLFASEYIQAAYPYLPTRVLKAAVTAHVGPQTCASVAQEMGVTPLLRWHRAPKTHNRPAVLHSDALASVPRSITALVYKNRSLPSARQFVHSYFLSREIDLRGMIKFLDPKKALLEMVDKFQRERPKSRLLKETGRFSNSPIYVVGIYSGADQLGEGFGSSLKMAEYRAAEDALHRVYLTRTPNHLIKLPSSTFPLGLGDVFKQDPESPETSYIAPELTQAEIMYSSSGRSSVLTSRRAE